MLTSAPGTICCVGIPFSTERIETFNGMLVSFAWTNISSLVANIPPTWSIINVWANGSTHLTGSVNLVIAVSCTTLSSVNSVVTNLGTLVDIITFSFVSNKPCAWYNASANVISAVLSLVLESVNLNSLVPVLNFSKLLRGIMKDPSNLPDASVSNTPLLELGCCVAFPYPTTEVWSENSVNDSSAQ